MYLTLSYRALRKVTAPIRRWWSRRTFNAQNYWLERHNAPLGIRSVANTGLSEQENELEYAEALEQLANYLKEDFAGFARLQVLDLGCGQGHYAKLADSLHVAAYTGLDFASPHLARLAQRYPRFVFVKADITENHPVFTRKHDAVLLIDTVYHITNDAKFRQLLRNIRRCVSVGSVIYITSNFEDSEPHRHMRNRSLNWFSSLTELGEVRGPAKWRGNSMIRVYVDSA